MGSLTPDYLQASAPLIHYIVIQVVGFAISVHPQQGMLAKSKWSKSISTFSAASPTVHGGGEWASRKTYAIFPKSR